MRRSGFLALALFVGCTSSESDTSSSNSSSPEASTAAVESSAPTSSGTSLDSATSEADGSGVPAPIDQASLLVLAEELGAGTLIVATSETGIEIDGGSDMIESRTVYVLENSSTATIDVMPAASVWADSSFIYAWHEDEETGSAYTVRTLDGAVVCETTRFIDHATRRADGGFEATVIEDLDDNSTTHGPYGLPTWLIDCATGASQSTEPLVQYGFDGLTTFNQQIGDRVFIGSGDAEGNADLVNEYGISINGDDYAGFHVFNVDGSVVVYGDMGIGASPHFTQRLKARDTTTGELLWEHELPQPFSYLSASGEKVFIGLADPSSIVNGTPEVTSVRVLDVDTGEKLAEQPAEFELLFIDA